MSEWRYDAEFADELSPAMDAILKRNFIRLISVERASFQQDTREATDRILVTNLGEIAYRARRKRCGFRDVTFRYRRRVAGRWQPGYEVDKILAGYGRAYLYVWERPA